MSSLIVKNKLQFTSFPLTYYHENMFFLLLPCPAGGGGRHTYLWCPFGKQSVPPQPQHSKGSIQFQLKAIAKATANKCKRNTEYQEKGKAEMESR